MQWVSIELCDLPTYEELPILEYFLTEFEEEVTEPQFLLALEFSLKVAPARWWVTHKHSIS